MEVVEISGGTGGQWRYGRSLEVRERRSVEVWEVSGGRGSRRRDCLGAHLIVDGHGEGRALLHGHKRRLLCGVHGFDQLRLQHAARHTQRGGENKRSSAVSAAPTVSDVASSVWPLVLPRHRRGRLSGSVGTRAPRSLRLAACNQQSAISMQSHAPHGQACSGALCELHVGLGLE